MNIFLLNLNSEVLNLHHSIGPEAILLPNLGYDKGVYTQVFL